MFSFNSFYDLGLFPDPEPPGDVLPYSNDVGLQFPGELPGSAVEMRPGDAYEFGALYDAEHPTPVDTPVADASPLTRAVLGIVASAGSVPQRVAELYAAIPPTIRYQLGLPQVVPRSSAGTVLGTIAAAAAYGVLKNLDPASVTVFNPARGTPAFKSPYTARFVASQPSVSGNAQVCFRSWLRCCHQEASPCYGREYEGRSLETSYSRRIKARSY